MAQTKIVRRALLFIISVLIILGVFTTLDAWHDHLRLSAGQEAEAIPAQHITGQTITYCSTHYLRCGHTVAETPILAGADEKELARAGWNLVWQEGAAYLSRESDGFCPTDQQKRHLRLYQEQLAIYAGPLGGDGELMSLLNLPLQAIPARWLAQLANGGIEFSDEETLLMALDNLDELTQEWHDQKTL